MQALGEKQKEVLRGVPAGRGRPMPRRAFHFVEREDDITLTQLVKAGIRMPATWGPMVTVLFRPVTKPIRVSRPAGGWHAVTVESNYGARSTLLYEADKDGRVSGILRLKRRER